MPTQFRLSCVTALLLALVVAISTQADPSTLSYQAYLTDQDGSPLSESVSVTARLYSAASQTLLYAESHDAVPVDNGLFQIAIGGGSVIAGTFGPELFAEPQAPLELELAINGETLAPPRPIRSAAHAQDARRLAGLSSEDFVQLDATAEQSISDGSLVVLPDVQSVSTQGEYQYNSPRTYVHAITADRFLPTPSDVDNWLLAPLGPYRFVTTAFPVAFALASLNLPAQARVKRLKCFFYDASSVDVISTLDVSLQYRLPDSIDLVELGELQTDSVFPGSSTDVRLASLVLPSGQAEIPAGAPLFLKLSWTSTTGGSALRFYGCEIEYELDRVSSN